MGIYKAFPLLKRKFPELNPFNIYEVGVNKNTGELLKNIHKFTVESKETKLKYILRKDKKLQQGKIICMKKSPGN